MNACQASDLKAGNFRKVKEIRNLSRGVVVYAAQPKYAD
jgi:hypothetical protein